MIKSILFSILIMSLTIACSQESRSKYTRESSVENKVLSELGQVIEISPNRNVEILFIVDPSASMASIIKEVHDNVDQFAAQFIEDKSSKVNFRIGVTTAWDAQHFARLERQKETTKDVKEDFWPNLNFNLVQGQLRPVVNNEQGQFNDTRIISWNMTDNNEELYEVIRETLKVNAEVYQYELVPGYDDKIRNVFQLHSFTSDPTYNQPGTREFVRYTTDTTSATDKGSILYGPSPENEEFFSTILTVLSDDTREMNSGFPSPDANQLAVFIITDAEDDSKNRQNISAEKVYDELVKFMGNDTSKVVVYGALYESDRSSCLVRALDQNGNFMLEPKYIDGHPGSDGVINPNYDPKKDTYKMTEKKRDPGYQGQSTPTKIEKLIRLSGGSVTSICSQDFGSDLASVGLSIKKKTIVQKNVHIDLRAAYDVNSVKVFYGEEEVPFIFSAQYNTGIVIDKADYTYVPGKVFKVKIEKLTRKNRLQGDD